MNIRCATVQDIEQIQIVRNSVKENVLSSPALVSDQDCIDFITRRGNGWVCQIDNVIVGFAVVDLQENNIWALFLLPEFEKMGIGRKLHRVMLDWYFEKSKTPVWLSTDEHTRAENFYRKAGWKEIGKYGKTEIKFEMTYSTWLEKNGNL
jgi:GNAT superfamily N-acetyltransferase